MKWKGGVVCCLFLVLNLIGKAQNVEQIYHSSPVSVGGNIRQSTHLYLANNISPRRPGYYWMFSANLNFSFFGVISMPFSINYSPQGKSLRYPYQNSQPFNQFGISPGYKGVTVHAGYRSMHFSDFTLSGNTFLGIGVELKPKDSKWQYAFMSGRFAKAVSDTVPDVSGYGFSNGITGYDRFGFALKARHGSVQNFMELTLFRAWDNLNSATLPLAQLAEMPKENLILSVHLRKDLSKYISADLEYAGSAYTRNMLNEVVKMESFTYLDNLGFIYRSRASSQYNGALKASVSYRLKSGSLKINYRRIGPEYTSMGIPFINNDVSDITGSLSTRMLKNKLTGTLGGGFQKNNLANNKVSQMTRIVGNAQIAYKVSHRMHITGSVANFNSSTVMTRIHQLDSLNYYQVTSNYTGMVRYKMGKQSKSQVTKMLILNSGFQQAKDISQQDATNMNVMGGVNMAVSKSAFSFSGMVNLNRNSILGADKTGIGPMLNLSKRINEGIKLGLSLNQLIYLKERIVVDRTTNLKTNVALDLKKGHGLDCSYSLVTKDNLENNIHFGENLFVIQYGYHFSKKWNFKSKGTTSVHENSVRPDSEKKLKVERG